MRPLWGYCVLALAVADRGPFHLTLVAQNNRKQVVSGETGVWRNPGTCQFQHGYDCFGKIWISTDLSVASDLADVLDDGDDFRVLPIIGRVEVIAFVTSAFSKASILVSPSRVFSIRTGARTNLAP